MATTSITLQRSGQTFPLGADDAILPDISALPTTGATSIGYRFVNTAPVNHAITSFGAIANIQGWTAGAATSVIVLRPAEAVEVMYNPVQAGWLVVSFSLRGEPLTS